ncbi:FKBP-type peptidyl-prolyl cis-trans isomerase [Maribacter ulvicola]|uniref:Peptidyl-prolyl cis-trans isomerase n=1 Tax=Maribacter ulvicola TaxID=228959 RepID=A0A1N6SPC5_9FLAO|nr:FKBP-type peptidyl-prolyl cis-trans isomerase [Maribacter ulvicola]SIQ42901.1 FKBP-type peptidyl-prolyl cis-trans isomerase [Maribacter ulvicola]
MKLKNAYLLIAGLLVISSCKNDDDTIGEVVPPRLLSEVTVEDDAEIVEFLKTHFYNKEEFDAPPEGFDFKIRFDTIAGENSSKQSLFDSPKLITQSITVDSEDFGLDDGEKISLKLYLLIAQQGVGGQPTIGDNSFIQYEGLLLDGNLFDASANQPARFYLGEPGLRVGFAQAVLKLKTGLGPIENGDGTVSYTDFGVAAVFMPSGLAYFNQTVSSIPAYSPLVFKLQALGYEANTDIDGDGIPSILEDLDGDGDLNNDNTDTELEAINGKIPNHFDNDDDGDGILTIDEIELDADGKFVGFLDTDGDGTPDHLDNDL